MSWAELFLLIMILGWFSVLAFTKWADDSVMIVHLPTLLVFGVAQRLDPHSVLQESLQAAADACFRYVREVRDDSEMVKWGYP